jgi:hypothetical protein
MSILRGYAVRFHFRDVTLRAVTPHKALTYKTSDKLLKLNTQNMDI